MAALMGSVRDLELAEDVLQDAFVAALQRWPEDGVPKHPRAWLLRTARHKAIDRFRRDANFQLKRAQLEVLVELERRAKPDEMDDTIEDERLRLVFTCCHPALAEPARVALTLRTIGGLTTTEIARAFLVPETTMAQPPVLTFQPPQLLVLGTGQSIGSPACIAIGLRDPVPDRLRRRLELT